MIRHLPGDILVTCQGTPAHTFTWLGHHACPKCRAALPIKTVAPAPLPPPQEDPTALIVQGLNRGVSLAQRAQGRWRLTGAWWHRGIEVKVVWEGNNRQRVGMPFAVTITYRLDGEAEQFATRKAAYVWLVDRVSSVPLWPWWMFQKER